MKIFARIILTLLAGAVAYCFGAIGTMMFFPALYGKNIIFFIVALLMAVTAGYITWKKSGALSNSLPNHMMIGAITFGILGFLYGSFMGGNLGPLFGVIFTGPVGFVLGLIVGSIYWSFKKKRVSKE